MFDRTYISRAGGLSHVTVAVTEKRAPTDESVRLLSEMENAARAKILASVPLPENTISGVLHHMLDFSNLRDCYLIQYRVNGTRREVPVNLPQSFASAGERQQQVATALVEALSRDIAVELLSSIPNLMGKL